MSQLSGRMRRGLIISLIAVVVIVAIGSAIMTVSAMRTVNTVDSLDTVRSSQSPLRTLTPPSPTATRATPSSTPTSTSKNITGTSNGSASLVAGSRGTPTMFTAMLASLATDDSPTSHVGYVREYFQAWVDANGDGCNTRAEVLILESLRPVTHTGTCTVSSGDWISAYDGVEITSASQLDIDHFVPLSEAWKSGAYAWDSQTRVAFGNDLGYPLSLIAVTASSNRSKGDKDPSQWMPSARDYYCDYAATWVSVKWRWSLTVDTMERRSLQAVFDGCSSTTVDIPQRAQVVVLSPEELANVSPGNSGFESGGLDNGSVDPDYGTCRVAKANGAGPYYQGVDTEYSWYRDADHDGIVCE